jgi:[acyl-carrier-protein] S-malonyltransferase
VISGEKKAIDYAILIAKEFGIKRAILLPVSGAFHSELMLDAKRKMDEALQNVIYHQPQVSVVANVTALPITDVSQVPQLLINQITGSVLWKQTNLYFANQQIERIIEVGSGKVLCGLASKTCPQIETLSLQNSQDIASFLATL